MPYPKDRFPDLQAKNEISPLWFFVLVTYFVFEYIRPQSYLPFLGSLKVPFLLTVTLIWFFVTKANREVFNDSLIKKYIVFVFLTFLGC